MVVRRAPFSANPQVGSRGQRTGQRILDATRTVLGRTGYHRCSVELIAREADCSRATFYQYFADKETAFAQLATDVADRLQREAESLAPITSDAAGWRALRAWVDRFCAVYDEHESVFHNFAAAANADDTVARQLERGAGHHRRAIHDRIAAASVPRGQLEAVIDVVAATLVRTLDDASALHPSSPVARGRLLDSYVDVVHRTLFGLQPDVNVHDHVLPARSARRRLRTTDAASPDGPTRQALVEAGAHILAESGFHGATIDAIVERAGMAHGTFYRYFEGKETLARELVRDASDKLAVHFADLVSVLSSRDDAALRGWLARYTVAQAGEMAILRVWSEAVLVDEDLRADAAPMLEWGRRQIARPLASRGFPGEQVDAMVMVALIDGLGAAQRPAATLDAAALVIERGVLGNRVSV